MEKNVNVSIAGVSFTLEAEAYGLLKNYLVSLEMTYKKTPDKEIIQDIEGRIAELILNVQGADVPVKAETIKDILTQMGSPGDAGVGNEIETEKTTATLPRRLYRNMDGAKLGGVCNGLATYFNIEPILIRLLFCLPLVLVPVTGILGLENFAAFFATVFGVSVLLYLMLWFVVPKARTPRQRLEMRGEKITADSIREGFAQDLKEATGSPKSRRNASALADFVYVLGRIMMLALKVVLIFIGIMIAIFTIVSIILAILVAVKGMTMLSYFGDSWFMDSLGINPVVLLFLGILFILIPIVMLGYLIYKAVFNLPAGKTVLSILFGIWIIILIFLTANIINNREEIIHAVESGEINNLLEQFDKNWEYEKRTVNGEEIYCRDFYTVFTKPRKRTETMISDSTRVDSVFRDGKLQSIDTVRVEYFTE